MMHRNNRQESIVKHFLVRGMTLLAGAMLFSVVAEGARRVHDIDKVTIVATRSFAIA